MRKGITLSRQDHVTSFNLRGKSLFFLALYLSHSGKLAKFIHVSCLVVTRIPFSFNRKKEAFFSSSVSHPYISSCFPEGMMREALAPREPWRFSRGSKRLENDSPAASPKRATQLWVIKRQISYFIFLIV